MNIEEIWKDIEKYEGYYQVSNRGRVRSLDRIVNVERPRIMRGRIKALKRNTDGYHCVTLNKDGRGKTIGVHRLVAQAFLPNPCKYKEVNHINFNRIDNNVKNLEWCSHKDNIEHSARNGRYKLKNSRGENNPNYGNDTLKKYYKQHPEEALRLCSRPKEKNGRSVKIALYDSNFHHIKNFDWIGGCAEFLRDCGYTNSKINTLREKISNAEKTGKKYLEHYYKRIA